MIKILRVSILLFLLVMAISGCYVTKKVVIQTFDFDKDISFTVDSVQEGKSVASGSGGYSAKKGFKLVMLFVSMKNHSDIDKNMDFNKFYLLDPKSQTKFKLEFTMLQTEMNVWGRTDLKIKKNDIKKRKLVFIFPENETAEMFSVDDEIHYIKYILPIHK